MAQGSRFGVGERREECSGRIGWGRGRRESGKREVVARAGEGTEGGEREATTWGSKSGGGERRRKEDNRRFSREKEEGDDIRTR